MIGCLLDTTEVSLLPSDHQINHTCQGTISFTRNGEHWGVAFSDPALTEGNFRPAVAPIYSGDAFNLIQPFPED